MMHNCSGMLLTKHFLSLERIETMNQIARILIRLLGISSRKIAALVAAVEFVAQYGDQSIITSTGTNTSFNEQHGCRVSKTISDLCRNNVDNGYGD